MEVRTAEQRSRNTQVFCCTTVTPLSRQKSLASARRMVVSKHCWQCKISHLWGHSCPAAAHQCWPQGLLLAQSGCRPWLWRPACSLTRCLCCLADLRQSGGQVLASPGQAWPALPWLWQLRLWRCAWLVWVWLVSQPVLLRALLMPRRALLHSPACERLLLVAAEALHLAPVQAQAAHFPGLWQSADTARLC